VRGGITRGCMRGRSLRVGGGGGEGGREGGRDSYMYLLL